MNTADVANDTVADVLELVVEACQMAYAKCGIELEHWDIACYRIRQNAQQLRDGQQGQVPVEEILFCLHELNRTPGVWSSGKPRTAKTGTSACFNMLNAAVWAHNISPDQKERSRHAKLFTDSAKLAIDNAHKIDRTALVETGKHLGMSPDSWTIMLTLLDDQRNIFQAYEAAKMCKATNPA